MAGREEEWQRQTSKNRRRKKNFRIIHDHDSKSSSASPYEIPIQIGGFSTDSKNNFCDDFHQMKYLCIPPMCKTTQMDAGQRVWTNFRMDLNEGLDNYVDDYNDEENSFVKLLQWICEHRKAVENMDSFKIDFICTRKVLECVFSTVYNMDKTKESDRSYDWSIYATKFQGVIYLRKFETEQAKEIEDTRDDDLKKIIYYGHKFERNLTSDFPDSDSKPNASRSVNVNEEFYAVMKSRFGNHGLIFSSQMDAVDPMHDSTPAKIFVEIKTNFKLNYKSGKRFNSFKKKLLSWYLQCYIAGVPRLICGFRDENGIVEMMEEYKVENLPGLAKNEFSPKVCFNFGSRFLDYVKLQVVDDDPNIVYKFNWKPGDEAICPTREILENSFLPNWYNSKMLVSNT